MRLYFSLLAAAGILCAQPSVFTYQRTATGPMGIERMMGGSIKGAPYSADVITETVQVLTDGNRIVERHTGFVARDSQGRTRNDTQIPVIGAEAQGIKLIMIHDPVAQVTYTLESKSKTARKMSTSADSLDEMKRVKVLTQVNVEYEIKRGAEATSANAEAELKRAHEKEAQAAGIHVRTAQKSSARAKTESLGTQVIEGVVAEGTRTTETIAAGEIGNERDIQVVNEVWEAQDLKAVVLSKRTDPRMGEMTYKLANIQRAEPAPSTFEVPADYKVVDGPEKGTFFFKSTKD